MGIIINYKPCTNVVAETTNNKKQSLKVENNKKSGDLPAKKSIPKRAVSSDRMNPIKTGSAGSTKSSDIRVEPKPTVLAVNRLELPSIEVRGTRLNANHDRVLGQQIDMTTTHDVLNAALWNMRVIDSDVLDVNRLIKTRPYQLSRVIRGVTAQSMPLNETSVAQMMVVPTRDGIRGSTLSQEVITTDLARDI